MAAAGSGWDELATSKRYMMAHGVRASIHRLGGFPSPNIRMHAHLAEVIPKSWLHEVTSGFVQRLAWRAEHFMNNRRRHRRCGPSFLSLKLLFFFLFTFHALPMQLVWCSSAPPRL